MISLLLLRVSQFHPQVLPSRPSLQEGREEIVGSMVGNQGQVKVATQQDCGAEEKPPSEVEEEGLLADQLVVVVLLLVMVVAEVSLQFSSSFSTYEVVLTQM